jgi:hypothetical protein
MRANDTALTAGWRMLSDHVAVLDQPWLPAASTALLAAMHLTVWSPIPLTAILALLTPSRWAGAPSSEHQTPAIPDGPPLAVAVTYCVPAVVGASVGPENETEGRVLSI